jgi:hypothetical protein
MSAGRRPYSLSEVGSVEFDIQANLFLSFFYLSPDVSQKFVSATHFMLPREITCKVLPKAYFQIQFSKRKYHFFLMKLRLRLFK